MNLLTNIKNAAGKGMLKMKAKSPEILIIAGIAGVVTSTVMACKATRKIDDIINDHEKHIDEIKNYVEENGYTKEYDEKAEHHDIFITYRDTAFKMIKLYAPSVMLGTLSVACIFQSHRILKSRLMAMSTLYNSTEKAFSAYRKRVADKIGAEEEKRLRYDVKREQIEEEGENGKKKKKIVDTVDQNVSQYSPYARLFNSESPMFERNWEYNRLFLVSQQEIANNLLKAHGFLFLNDVYEMLGLHKTEAGQRVGWIYDEKNPIGDNYVDFGIYDLYSRKGSDFVNGYEQSILLDFNVDGDILTLAFSEKI